MIPGGFYKEVKMPQIVEVKHLSKTFTTKEGQVDALRDINLSIEKGDIYGIIGMSGAGKSTLVRCLNFLEVPTSLGQRTESASQQHRYDLSEFQPADAEVSDR